MSQTECETVRESTKRYFWKRLGWLLIIKDFSAKLRFTIAYANHSTDQTKGKPPEIVGHASFSLDELRTSAADELGVKRVSFFCFIFMFLLSFCSIKILFRWLETFLLMIHLIY